MTFDQAFKEKVCVVTGASGFIGRHLSDRLRATGASVHEWRQASVDLLDPTAVAENLIRSKPNFVFHLAANGIAHDRAHCSTIIGENVAMVSSLIDGLSARPVTKCRVIVAGSMSEYGPNGSPFAETSPCVPTTAYGISKLASTLFTLAHGQRSGVNTAVARIFGAYGTGEMPTRLFPSLLRSLRRKVSVELSDGKQLRDFIHVHDVCEGLMRIAVTQSAQNQILNLGTGVGVSVRSVCKKLAEELRVPSELLIFGARERSPGDADRLVADTSKLAGVLGWVPPQRLNELQLLRLWEDRLRE